MDIGNISVSNKQRTWLRRVLASRMKSTFVVPAVGAGIVLGAAALPARATDYVVGTAQGQYATLADAITASNASGTGNTISFDSSVLTNGTYTFNGDDANLPLITKDVAINGAGVIIDANNERGFMVGDGISSTINVSFNNLTITNAVAQGSAGGDGVGGGGGAGLGGAVFANSNANITLNSVSFSGNKAQGGDGGATTATGASGGGGGGGLNGGGDGSDSSGTTGGNGGGANGGTGSPNGIGGFGGFGGGGGGGGGTITSGMGGHLGGTGGFGGGGGGAGTAGDNTQSIGGQGGFGGGSGASYSGWPTSGGFGGGSGNSNGAGGGGGGAGFGGAVFVRQGGSLTITGTTDINSNSVYGGTGNEGGQAAGSGIFINDQGLTFNIGDGESTSITDDIADSSAGVGLYLGEVGAGSLIKNGAGTLILGGNNTFTGGTTVNEGTLQIFNATGNAALGDVTIDGGQVQALFHNASPGTYSTTLGTQTLSGDTEGHYGDNDFTVEGTVHDTITINGIKTTGVADPPVITVGGGNHTITGNGNNFEIDVTPPVGPPFGLPAIDLTDPGSSATVSTGTNTVTGSNNTFLNDIQGNVALTGDDGDQTVLTLDGGTNLVNGSSNTFTNTVEGNITADDNSLVNLNAGSVATGVNNTNNQSGNTITGNVTLTNDSELDITGQTTSADNTGNNKSFNDITGIITANDSTIDVTGHNNTVANGVSLTNSDLTVGSNTLTNISDQNLENSISSGVTLDSDSAVNVGLGGSFFDSNGNTILNQVDGNVDLNGGALNLGSTLLYDTAQGNVVTNTVSGDITGLTSGSNITQSAYIQSLGGTANNNNIINNEINQDLTLSSGVTLTQGSGIINMDGSGNQINNSVTGNVTVNGGLLQQQGGYIYGYDNFANGGSSSGYSATDDNGNQVTNLIDGTVTVENNGVFLINGERNIVNDGVTTTSALGTYIGSNDVTAGGALIYNESIANHTINGGQLHLGTSPSGAQTISGDSNSIVNRVIGDASSGIEGTITVDGEGSVLGLGDGLGGELDIDGVANHVNNYVGNNGLDSEDPNYTDAQLQAVTNGGKVLLGGRTIIDNTTGFASNVTNMVDQDVTLEHGNLELAGIGAGSTTDNTVLNVFNEVTGDVIAGDTIDGINGEQVSNVYLHGSNGDNAFNTIDGQVILSGLSFLQVEDGGTADDTPGNLISGGVRLSDHAHGNVGRVVNNESLDQVLNTGTGGVRNTGNGIFSVGNAHDGITGNTVTNTSGSGITVNTTLDNSDYDGFGAAVKNTGGGLFLVGSSSLSGDDITVNNTEIGDIFNYDSLVQTNGTIDGSGSHNTLNNLITGDVFTLGGSVQLTGTINPGAGFSNAITNTIDGNVTARNGEIDLGLDGAAIGADNPADPDTNSITNEITQDVNLYGTSGLYFTGDNNAADNNIITNKVDGAVYLNGGSDSVVTGANNSITDGLILNTTTTYTTPHAPVDEALNDTTDAVIGGGSDASATSITNSLDADVTINANPYSTEQRNEAHGYGFGPGGNGYEADHGYDTDSGHLLVGALGATNTVGTGQSITNILNGDVLLNGGTANNVNDTETGDGTPTGGMVIVGAANDNNLSGTGTVTNEINGTVTLHGGSRLHLGGDGISGDGTGSVNNTVAGAVNADGNSFVAMWGENDTRLHNTIGADLTDSYGLTLTDNALFHAEGVNNTVDGLGTELSGSAIAQLGGSGGSHAPISQMNGGYTLNGSSQLQLGSLAEFSAGTGTIANTIFSNGNNGNVVLNDTSTLKVLSGGAGGLHSAAGSNEIKNNLILNGNEGSTSFLVAIGDQGEAGSVSTGVAVDGTAALNGAQVKVVTDSPFTFGRRYTLVQAIGDGYATSGFAPQAELTDAEGNALTQPPALELTTGWNSDSAWLDILTDFHDVANTKNQQHFAQYLDSLVANSGTDGIVNDPDKSNDLSDLLNLLMNQSNPNAYNNFLGDSYSAFDMAGYWNANRFTNTIATHARQSHDSDWTETFAMNAQQGLSGLGAQMSLVQQLLEARPALQLAADGDSSYGNDSALWDSISGDWLRNDGDSHLGSPDWNLNTKSVAIGYQGGSNSFSWGITGGYHDGNLDFNNRAADGDNDGWSAGLNGLWQSKSHVYVNGVLSYNHDSDSLTRNDGLGINRSDFNAKSISALLELGKQIDKKTYHFTPYVSLLGVRYDRDDASERGTGAGLDVDGESHSYLTSTLGVRIGKDYLDKSGQKRGGVMLGANWQHQFSSTDFPVTASLQSAGGMTPASFTTYGTPLSSDSLGLQLGAYGRLSKNFYGFLNYNGNFGGNQTLHSITAGLQYGF